MLWHIHLLQMFLNIYSQFLPLTRGPSLNTGLPYGQLGLAMHWGWIAEWIWIIWLRVWVKKNGKLKILWLFTKRQILALACMWREAFHPPEGDPEHRGPTWDCWKMSPYSWRGKVGQDLKTVQTTLSDESIVLSCSDWFWKGLINCPTDSISQRYYWRVLW